MSDIVQTLFASLPEPAFVKDVAGRFRLLNQASADILGVPEPSAAIGKTDADFFPADQAAAYAAEERTLIVTGQPLVNLLHPLTAPDGTQRWLLMTKVPVRNAEGRIVGILGTAKDVTTQQMTTDAVLRAAETRYQDLVERLPVVVYTQLPGVNGDVTYTSPQFETLLGYSAAEWDALPGTWLDSVHPEDRQRVETALADPAAREHFACEYRLRTKDGHWLWLRDEAVLVRDATGAPLHWQGVMTDITAQRAAVAALRESEARLRAVWEASPDAIALSDPAGIVLAANPAYGRIYGYPPEQIVGQHFSLVYPEGERNAFTVGYEQVFAGPASSPEFESSISRRDGSARSLAIRLSFIERDGVRTGAVTIARDISERKRIAAELSEAEERFRTFFEEIPGLTYIYAYAGETEDSEHDVLYRSHQFELLTGYPNTVWEKDRTFIDAVIHPEDRAWVRAYDELVMETGEPYLAEYRITAQDGRLIWVREQARMIRNADSKPRYWVGIVTDISAEKAAEAATAAALTQLEASNRDLAHQNAAKSAFVSTISHEFRTPLTSIQGFSELILTEAESLDDAQAFAQIINQNALRLGRLVRDVLDLDRMTAGPVPLNLTAINLNDLVTATLDDFRGQSAHQLVSRLDEELPVIIGDVDRLTQVVTNVLANAIKYSPDGGTITVATYAQSGGAELSIADEGLGIPVADRETIFAPYERIRRPDHPTIEGTGLGLPISRNIVMLHGGKIWVEPNMPRGSIFHVWLPRGPGTP